MATIRGKECSKSLSLDRILNKWLRTIKQVTDTWARYHDVPWWYNERADLSILAGAVWKCREVAVEEFVSRKRRIARSTGRLSRKYSGRIDFYFTAGRHHFIAEAKECWSRAGNEAADPRYKVEKMLERARQDIRKVTAYGDRKLAILFVKPSIPRRKRKQSVKLIRRWLAAIRTIECDAKAWYFPENARYAKWDDRFYPGVVILIAER